MGCTSSTLDNLPAVALCRERWPLLDDAIHQRYALAEAHMSYLHSLEGVGLSLLRFFDHDLDHSTSSPVLNLSPKRNGDPISHSHSNSGSHIQFHDSDSDSDSDDSASKSPLHHRSGNKTKATSSGYEQRPMSAEAAASEASTSKPPPPLPLPPRSSGGDFPNPFQSSEKYYPPYRPSRESKEFREEEGITDLEDEDFQQEEVKKVYSGGGGKNYAKGVAEEQDGKKNASDSLHDTRPMRSHPVKYERHTRDKKVVENEEKSGERGNVSAFKARGDAEVVREIQVQFELASESGNALAKILEVGKFPHDKNASYQVSTKMLHLTTPSWPVVSSQHSKNVKSFSVGKAEPAFLDIDDEVVMGSGNLSSTLQKLHLWERKLYEEVKVGEKMRILYERKCLTLNRLCDRGASLRKVDATRVLMRSLYAKVRISVEVVGKISVKINKLRDEELWPQLNELIQGLTRMWKAMLECHRSQCQAIRQAKRLDAVAFRKYFSDTCLEATLQLEHDLLNWTSIFSYWLGAQKGFVRALNYWLLKSLLYEPEETAEGILPFSPGRIGAPPVFVICNQWSQALETIPEKEVVDSMRDFATSVLRLWEQDKLEMRQRMVGNKDMEREVKNLEKEEQKIQKEIQALDKRIGLSSGDGNCLPLSGLPVHQSDTNKTSSLQVSLLRIFDSMEMFSENSLRVYEELLQRIEEHRQDRLPQRERERKFSRVSVN